MNYLRPKRNKLIATFSFALVLICITGTVLKIRGKNAVEPKRVNEYILSELNDKNVVAALYCDDLRVVTLNGKPAKARLALFNDTGETFSETENVKDVNDFGDNKACDSPRFLAKPIQSCGMNRRIINKQVEGYYFVEGTWPRDDLADIKTNVNYFPDGIPTCPVDLTSYVLRPSPYHRVSGHKEGEGTHIYLKINKQIDERNIQTFFDLFYENDEFVYIWKKNNDIYASTSSENIFVFDKNGNFKRKMTNEKQIDAIMEEFIKRILNIELLK